MDKNYEYEKAMLDTLNETFQDAIRQKQYAEKWGHTDPRMSGYVDKAFDKAIWQKELVEAVIGECVNLQKDGHIRIGVDNPIDYEDYLETIKDEQEKDLS